MLFRPYFNIDEELIYKILIFIARYGEEINSKKTKIKMNDESDRKFYDIIDENKDIYLISGNKKYFPKNKRILSVREFVEKYEDI